MDNTPETVPSAEGAEWRVEPADWEVAVGRADGPQIVVGGPGTGKTEFLVRRAVHLLGETGLPPDQLLVLSFGRRGVADVRDRIRTALDSSTSTIDVATFHSFAARLLETFSAVRGWAEAPQVLTGPEQVALIQELLATENPKWWSPAFRELLGSTTFAREVTDFVLRTRELLLEGDALAERAVGRADWKGISSFVARYDLELRRRARIDYGTLLAEAVWAMDDPDVAAHIAERFRYVLVDEYQDTTVAQSHLLARLTPVERNLTVAADPYQSIYSFRGATLDNVANFPTDFPSEDGTPAQRLILTTSFRTPAAVLEAAVRVTSHELPGAAGPVIPAPGGGRVDVHSFDQETEEAEWIAAETLRLHLEEGIPYRRIGVFVRSKRRFLPDLSRALHRRRIPHDTPDSRLTDHPAVRFVMDAVIAATNDDDRDETARSVRRVLLGPLFGIPLGLLREVDRYRVTNTTTWSAAIRALVPDGAPLADLLADASWATDRPARDAFWALWSRLPQIVPVVSDPARHEERAAWSSFAQVLHRWNERNPSATLDDYRRLADEEEFEARPLLSYDDPDDDRLALTTLHQCKGLEFDTVFIADAVEGVFPDLRSRDSLLGVRHLLTHLPAGNAEYLAFRLQEERRLAYTAMTRAQRRVVWTSTATGFEEGRGIPSRFLALVAGTDTVAAATTKPARRTTPVTPQEAEAAVRRMLVDPEEGTPLRLAALKMLASGTDHGLRSATTLAGVKRRGPDTGIIGDTVRLSPSQATAYEDCPRRYALERGLKVGNETSVYADFGLLIHEVLEVAERAARERDESHSDAAEAIGVLRDVFEPAVFGGGAFAAAWYERAESTLTHLYAHWPTRGNVIDLERQLILDIKGVSWIGYADRIESDGLGLKIVDYKTTRNPPSKNDVAASLQLGYYVLAAAADPELAEYGTPESAEMWFPAKTAKSVITRTFDMETLADVEARLVAIAEAIRSEEWPAQPSASCERCRVRTVCPAWPEGREAFQS